MPECVARSGEGIHLVDKFVRNFVFNFYSSNGVVPGCFGLSIVSENKIFKYLSNLSFSKAAGLDGIPARFVKDSASSIANPLSHIINLSNIQGVVPDDFKTARVVPLFKKNDKTEVNYRPVSILSIVSKVLKKVVYDQMEEYLCNKDPLYKYQSGLRRQFSTESCLLHFTDYIRFEMDKGNFAGMILLDLQKAFDTVDHSIHSMKLQALGLNELAVRWFSSYMYLSDRH